MVSAEQEDASSSQSVNSYLEKKGQQSLAFFCFCSYDSFMAQSAYDKAVSLLAVREHTKKELNDKLMNKGYGKEEIEDAILRLEKEGYISEERFAEVFIRSRLKKSPEGKSVLLYRLAEKGCQRDIAANAIDEAWEDKLWLDPLKKGLETLERRKGEEYALSKMRQKGCSYSEIREAKERDE